MFSVETVLEQSALSKAVEKQPSALDRRRYLCPSRYFRFYMFHERASRRTCWLPEGFRV